MTGKVDHGKLIYATGKDTFTLSATTNIKAVGKVLRHRTSTSVDALMFSAAQMATERG